jgi:hypothetical protein
MVGLVLRSRAKPTLRTLLGLAVGFGGVVVLLGVAGAGAALIVAAAACYAVGAVLVRRWFSDVPPLVVVAGMLALAAPILIVLSMLVEPLPSPSWLGLSALAALGLVSTVSGFVAFFALINLAGPDRAALITYVAPVVAMIGGAVLLAEPVGPRSLVGTGLIFVGRGWRLRRRNGTATATILRRQGPRECHCPDRWRGPWDSSRHPPWRRPHERAGGIAPEPSRVVLARPVSVPKTAGGPRDKGIRAGRAIALRESVNGSPKLISWRLVKTDHLRFWRSSVRDDLGSRHRRAAAESVRIARRPAGQR